MACPSVLLPSPSTYPGTYTVLSFAFLELICVKESGSGGMEAKKSCGFKKIHTFNEELLKCCSLMKIYGFYLLVSLIF